MGTLVNSCIVQMGVFQIQVQRSDDAPTFDISCRYGFEKTTIQNPWINIVVFSSNGKFELNKEMESSDEANVVFRWLQETNLTDVFVQLIPPTRHIEIGEFILSTIALKTYLIAKKTRRRIEDHLRKHPEDIERVATLLGIPLEA